MRFVVPFLAVTLLAFGAFAQSPPKRLMPPPPPPGLEKQKDPLPTVPPHAAAAPQERAGAASAEPPAPSMPEMQAQDQQIELQMVTKMLAMREQQIAKREDDWKSYFTGYVGKRK